MNVADRTGRKCTWRRRSDSLKQDIRNARGVQRLYFHYGIVMNDRCVYFELLIFAGLIHRKDPVISIFFSYYIIFLNQIFIISNAIALLFFSV